MRKINTLLTICAAASMLHAQPRINPDDYKIDAADVQRAEKLIAAPVPDDVVMPTRHPDAQWYPGAALGLFMHWGIHSVDGIQPSWNMIKHYRYGGKRYHSPKRYYRLARKFKPTILPDSFLTAAHDAGFTYAVLTTRHHDGYALWPSKYGIGVRHDLPGRDLVREYVDACRAAGLKVGLYFSPRDWHYPEAMAPCEFNVRTRSKVPAITDSVANRTKYVRFVGYVMRQLEELLTHYGKIDLLWLDGMEWRGITENNTEKIYCWIRTMQPGIVINDRWANLVDPDNPDGTSVRIGDLTTPLSVASLPISHRPGGRCRICGPMAAAGATTARSSSALWPGSSTGWLRRVPLVATSWSMWVPGPTAICRGSSMPRWTVCRSG